MAMVASVLAISTLSLSTATTASAASNSVTVTIFGDTDYDGVFDGTETGVAGVAVHVFAPGGTAPTATVTTDAGGVAVFTAATDLSAGDQYRLEVDETSLPAGMAAGTNLGDASSFTRLIDVSAGPVSLLMAATDGQRCTDFTGPTAAPQRLIMSCFGAHDDAIVIGGPDTANGQGEVTPLISTSQVGTVNGLAYQPSTGRAFAGSFFTAGLPLGPGGHGEIYVVDTNNPGTLAASIDIPNAGTTDPTARSIEICCGGSEFPGYYAESGPEVGKEGLGDVEISDDGNTLWTINLNTKELIKVDIADPTYPVTSLGPIDLLDGCRSGNDDEDWRPHALAFHDGDLYVGGVCTGESLNTDPVFLDDDNNATSGTTDPADQMSARVLRFHDPLNFASSDQVFVWSEGIDDLRSGFGAPTASTASGWMGNDFRWMAWKDDPRNVDPDPGEASWQSETHTASTYSQPWLTDLEFDDSDSLVLGFRNRADDQAAVWDDDLAAMTRLRQTSGDINHACFDGSAASPSAAPAITVGGNGAWDFEGTGACTIPAGNPGNSPGEPDAPNVLATTEWYVQDFLNPLATFKTSETAQGHLAYSEGSGHVATTANSLVASGSFGAEFFTDDGITLGRTPWVIGQDNADPAFDAANTGDIEYVTTSAAGCTEAPQELGDLVWFDTDGNGIQDAGEAGIAGVTVNLYDPTNQNLLGTTITDADGRFVFTVHPTRSYELRFDNAADYAAGGPLEGLDLTLNRASSGIADGRDGERDSDASIGASSFATIAVTTGAAGDSMHDADAGFQSEVVATTTTAAPTTSTTAGETTTTTALATTTTTEAGGGGGGPTTTVPTTTIPGQTTTTVVTTTTVRPDGNPIVAGTIWNDADQDGIQNGTVAGVAGVPVVLRGSDNAILSTTFTDADGNYEFFDVANVQYLVEIVTPAGWVLSPDNVGNDDAVDSDLDSTLGTMFFDVADGGATNDVDAGIWAVEPITGPSEIEGIVWNDLDGNGIQDPGEPAVGGSIASLYEYVDTNPVFVTDLTVGSDGVFSFAGLEAGIYEIHLMNTPGAWTATLLGNGTEAVDNDVYNSVTASDAAQTTPFAVVLGTRITSIDAGLQDPDNVTTTTIPITTTTFAPSTTTTNPGPGMTTTTVPGGGATTTTEVGSNSTTTTAQVGNSSTTTTAAGANSTTTTAGNSTTSTTAANGSTTTVVGGTGGTEVDLSVTATPVGAPTPGGSMTWKVTVGNDGNGDEEGPVSVVIDLPQALGPVGASGPGASCVITGERQMVCRFPNGLPADTSVDLSIVTDVANGLTAGQTLSIDVSVLGSTSEAQSSNNDDSAVVTVGANDDLPFTGANSTGLMLFALALGAAGVSLVLGGRDSNQLLASG